MHLMLNSTEFCDTMIIMQDLIAKILELRKSLAAMKPKSASNSLVPALSVPGVKPLSMPSASSMTAPKPKLPGMSPTTTKDPKKMAEQLKNPRPKKPKIEVLKVENNGQWMLKADSTSSTIKAPQMASVMPIKHVVNAKNSGFKFGHHSPEQDQLAHGVNFATAKPVNSGINNAMWMKSDSHPHTVIAKNASLHPNRPERGHEGLGNLDSAKREVLYHNMARDFFGMGKYVPTTAGFTKDGNNYSVQKKVEGASHPKFIDQVGDKALRFENPNHAKVAANLHDSGELHKLALMDHIMGHHDRHRKNYMIDDKGPGVHLVDNGTAFDYRNFDPRNISPLHESAKSNSIEGMGKKDDVLHPEAQKWLMNLDPKKAAEVFANHSHPQDSEHAKGFTKRLKSLQDKVKKGSYGNVERLLAGNRGPMHEHHSKKKAA
jgi:hypothetical protein